VHKKFESGLNFELDLPSVSPSFFFFLSKNEFTMTNKLFFLSVLFSISSLTACRDEAPVIGSISLDEYNPEHNILIGDAVDQEAKLIYPTLSIEEAPEATQYLKDMLSIVITTPAFTNRILYNWQVSIIPDDSKTNAFALPNGHLYIHSGLLRYLETESQLISLLAHEFTYVEKGMATLLLENEFGSKKLGDIILNNGQADVGAMAEVFPTLAYGEVAVETADEFSVEVLCPFVYEARGIVKIIEKSEEFPDETLEWLEMRPAENNEERIDRINIMADECGLDGVKNAEEYRAFLTTF
jgi:hypothetical protein